MKRRNDRLHRTYVVRDLDAAVGPLIRNRQYRNNKLPALIPGGHAGI